MQLFCTSMSNNVNAQIKLFLDAANILLEKIAINYNADAELFN